MALNFPSSPTLGQVYTDTTSGFSYEWTGVVWKSFTAANASTIKSLDDISSGFNSSTQTFALTSSGIAVYPISDQQLIVNLGGVVQDPVNDYNVSGSNITFTTAPASGLSFSATLLGVGVPIDYANSGNVYERQVYTATAGQTTFTFTAGYTPGYLDVYRNGVRLASGTDFTATNGTSFVLTTPALLNDEVEAIGYKVKTIVTSQGDVVNLNVTGIATISPSTFINNAGINVVGVVTATTFSGNATTATLATNAQGLTGSPNITVGNITSGNINSSGVVTATTFSGSLTGNVTGNATGLTGNPSITVTNATVNGVLSVGGTTVILNAATLQINDRDITLGITTDAFGNNVANDITANHGGISIASTVGTPIITIPTDAVNSDLPTNKQIMWVKENHYSGLATDAWILNYGVSIGNTSTVQNGSRLTVGAGFTVYDTLVTAQNVRASGINVSGIGTIIDTRIQSVGEKTTRVNGNTVNLVYNTGGGNVAICTNPSGNITLNVTGIPLTSDFDNTSITFAVISNASAGVAYSCLTVTLNGLTPTIRWAGGSSQAATSGVTTSAGYTFYSFSGINTVGSASTTANYTVLGTVSGGYF